MPVLAVFSAVLSKVAAYGFLRDRAAALPRRRADFQELMLVIALASILYGSAMAFTHDRGPARARLLVGRPARLHHARDLLPRRPRARRARCCSRSTTASSSRALFFIVALLAERAGG